MLSLPDEAVFKDNIHRRHLTGVISGHLDNLNQKRLDHELVLVCFTNRCGSNYLCDLLFSTGEFNRGGEFLNYDTA